MTLYNLFGHKEGTQSPQAFRLKVIRPVYESLFIGEEAAQYLDVKEPLSSAAHVTKVFSFLAQETKEYFLSLHLDAKNRLLCMEIVSVGTMTASLVHPREVFKSALLSSASAMIFLHNHPSGDCNPSCEDRELTKRLQNGGKLLGIRVLDHLILGSSDYFSFTDRGEL